MESNYIPGYDAKTGDVILPHKYQDFPYPSRNCPFCEKELIVVNAIHATNEPYIFKAIYLCLDRNCGCFDLEARSAYSRVYYSCNEALEAFETIMLKYSIEVKQ
jgi:hypothetical protein